MPTAADGEPLVPFDALAPASYLAKVKTLLTGAAPTDAEVGAVTSDGNKLKELVEQWMTTDAYRSNMQNFFADAFQQSIVDADAFLGLGDVIVAPTANLLLNFRESFGRTVMALNDEGQPFTSTVTTQRYMMTTAMMSFMAYLNASARNDAGAVTNRLAADNNWRLIKTNVGGPISTRDSANPASPRYMTFYDPNLTRDYNTNNATPAAVSACNAAGPLVFDKNKNNVALGARLIHRMMVGDRHVITILGQDGNTYNCFSQGMPSWFTASDYNDWRMVAVVAPTADAPADAFFDLESLRSKTTLRTHYPAVGFFTTPSFVAQWSSNKSNLHRVTINQTMITALGEAIDGQDQLPLTDPSAVDQAHAASPACFGCHQTVDPMRQFFRQSFTTFFAQQQNNNMLALPATFAFRGITRPGHGVYDLANIIASHPNFALAWTVKLCSWANSSPCLANDPEVLRIAELFASSNFSFPVLAKEMFSSPLVTYASRTATATINGQQASIARRHAFCAILNARLGTADVCDEGKFYMPGTTSVPSLSRSVSPDFYSRGVKSAMYVTGADPFSRANYELICASLAGSLVDGQGNSWASSRNVPAGIGRMVHELMGISASEDAQPLLLLQGHYDGAVAAGKTATVALRSAFVVACTSPFVTSIGH